MTEPSRRTPRSTPAAAAPVAERRASWLQRRARNVARRPMAIATYGVVIFVVALVALVVAPATARREAPPPPPPPRPDTVALRAEVNRAATASRLAEAALAEAREMATRPAEEPVLVDTLTPALRARRDSLTRAIDDLSRLLRRAEEAPLVASWRALGETPHLRGTPRVRQIVDSLIEVDRSRTDFGAAGGVDPIFVALTARAGELGRELQAIAERRREALRAEVEPLRPVLRQAAPRAPAVDTTPRLVARDSARRSLERAERSLARARALHHALDEEAAREREDAARSGASPIAMLAAAIVLGLALGYAVTLVSEMQRPSIADGREASMVADAPVLVRVRPRVDMPERGRRRADRELSPLMDIVSGSYDVLLGELDEPETGGMVLAVVGEHPGVTATVAANLAAAAAQSGRSALAVDADFATHAVSVILRTRRSPGVFDLLAGRVGSAEAIRTAMVGRDRTADVLPSGRPGSRWTLHGAVEQFGEELRHLAKRYDLVLVNAPESKFGVVPAASAAVRKVIVCARHGRTAAATLRQLVRTVRDNGARVHGLVMWEADDPVPTMLSDADRAAGRATPLPPETAEHPSPTGFDVR